jgi:hypothetical protein
MKTAANRASAATDERSTSMDHIAAMDRGARWCYYVPDDANYDGNGFVPSLVVEDVPGHVPMTGSGVGASPWYWGKTIEDAREACERKNVKLGISKVSAAEIVASSMCATNAGRQVAR